MGGKTYENTESVRYLSSNNIPELPQPPQHNNQPVNSYYGMQNIK